MPRTPHNLSHYILNNFCGSDGRKCKLSNGHDGVAVVVPGDNSERNNNTSNSSKRREQQNNELDLTISAKPAQPNGLLHHCLHNHCALQRNFGSQWSLSSASEPLSTWPSLMCV